MRVDSLLKYYEKSSVVKTIVDRIVEPGRQRMALLGNVASSNAFVVAAVSKLISDFQVVVFNDREEAAYFYNDIQKILGILKDEDMSVDESSTAEGVNPVTDGNKSDSILSSNKADVFDDKTICFLPSSYRRSIRSDEKDNDSVLLRIETLNLLKTSKVRLLVTYAEALAERLVEKKTLEDKSLHLKNGDRISISALENKLNEYGFVRSDFVYEPGEFSIRGSIVDVYSYAEERPIRIDFFGNEIDSIRYFDIETQLSEKVGDSVSIVPDLSSGFEYNYTDISDWIPDNSVWWVQNGMYLYDKIKRLYEEENASALICSEKTVFKCIDKGDVIEWGNDLYYRGESLELNCVLQSLVNKRFDMFAEELLAQISNAYKVFICSNNKLQIQRIRDIFADKGYKINFTYIENTIHEGFYDKNLKLCIYTEHQIFDRYHKYRLQTSRMRKGREAITISELHNLHPGDYVVHIDHGIGRFGGLVKVDNNGNVQEAIRLVYKNNSELYVGIHSLHKISKYRSKDGTPPNINKLGGDAWNKLKQKTKSKVKDIARELILLYAKRKQEKAFAFSKDSFLQEEMEASFVYEETPDQMRAIEDVKADMESPQVMDRLVCGDVGFGKTEVAMRAAFKAVADNKQVAVLVPTTVLAYQHYNSFVKRLEGLPCRIEYVSRMRKPSDVKRVLKELKEGKVDIVIGTHRLAAKDVEFKDLGLLIIDEEQKFGVGVKEKLKNLKLNVDTITMTATPIPRTLQFSLMGARDMSIIRTAPANRYPIVTELHRFDEDLIREVVLYEIARGGQVFFIHNRVDTLMDIEGMLHRLIPQIKTCVAHGQMQGEHLEEVMHDFMRGDFDVLIATTIIESGLDIPNANTIIINQAQNHGLSDLHQLRGRVGRSNRKAFCYLLSPPLDMINSEARRRLKAIEDFSGLGSGFNIAMQDLDIRGAGNILGAEQSGFITEIGYETYQKILNEALSELREENLFDESSDAEVNENQQDSSRTKFVGDCVIETDFEALIPETYVESISERIRLYRDLDNMDDDNKLSAFAVQMKDRFGEIPEELNSLMEVVRIRSKCEYLGIERLLAKNSKLVLYFVYDSNSFFYQTNVFTMILQFVQKQIYKSKMMEKNGKLTLSFANIDNMKQLSKCINKFYDFVFNK